MSQKNGNSVEYRKGYKEGYNNPSQFDQAKVKQINSDMARGIIDGICQRAKDQANGTVKFITK